MLAAPIENRIFFGQIKFLLLGTVSGKGVSNGMSREHKAEEEGAQGERGKSMRLFNKGLKRHDSFTTGIRLGNETSEFLQARCLASIRENSRRKKHYSPASKRGSSMAEDKTR